MPNIEIYSDTPDSDREAIQEKMKPGSPQITQEDLEYFFVLFGIDLQQRSQVMKERIIKKRIDHIRKAVNLFPLDPE